MTPTLSARQTLYNHARQVSPSRWLIVMVKAPVAGRVKTRLGADIGTIRATSFYRAASSAVIGRLACDRRWLTVLSIAPDTALKHPQWPAHIPRMAQGRGDLGTRMENAFKALPPGPAILIGSDIPDVRSAHIADGFRALGNSDVIFGPADDGGYWLVGMARRQPVAAPFKGVRWSSPQTLADNLRVLRDYRQTLVNQLSDVDTSQDYCQAAAWAGRRVLPAGSA